MPAATSKEKLMLKTSFKSTLTLESFYTGGPLALSTDEKYLFCADGEEVHVVDASSGTKLYTIKGDTETVTAVAPTPDGTRLFIASRSLLLHFWTLPSLTEGSGAEGESKPRATLLRQWKSKDSPVLVADYDASGSYLATGSADGTVQVWDVAKGFSTHLFRSPTPGLISSLRFGPSPVQAWTLYSGSENGMIRAWDLKQSKCVMSFEGHDSVVRGLALTQDGRTLVSAARDQMLMVWDTKTGKTRRAIPVYETLEAVGILSDGKTAVSAGEKGLIQCWDLKSGELVGGQKPEPNAKHTYVDMLMAAGGSVMIGITNDQNLLYYHVGSDEEEGKVVLHRERQILGYHDEVLDVVFVGPKEEYLAVATNTEQVRMMSLEGKGNAELLYGHSDMVLCLGAWQVPDHPSKWFLVTGSKDKTARVWLMDFDEEDAEDRYRCVAECVGHAEAIGAVAACAPDYLLTGSQDRTVKCWSLRQLAEEEEEEEEELKRLASVWTQHAHDKDINALDVAPNGKLFASASQDKTIKVWSAEEGTLLGTCKGHKRGVWSVRFSPVDKVMATSSGDKTVRLWSLTDYTCLKTFEGHTNTVLRVDFLSAGLQLVSSGSDGLVKVWSVRGEECMTTLDGHTEKVWALGVHGDGKAIASGGGDSVIHVWTDMTEEEREEEAKRREVLVEREQRLSNLLATHDWRGALNLALELEQPSRVLGLFTRMLDDREVEEIEGPGRDAEAFSGHAGLDDTVKSLTPEKLASLFRYLRDWNTNARHARVAQIVLYTLLNTYGPEELEGMEGYREVVEGLIPFTERHFKRIEQLLVDSYLVDYTLQVMDQSGIGGRMAEDLSKEEDEGEVKME